MYYHPGSQQRPLDAASWLDLRENRLHDNRGAYETTLGRPVVPNVHGGLELPNDDVFGIGPTRGSSTNTVHSRQGPMRHVRAYLLHQEHILKCTSYPIVPI
jgi:hypothetical protein